MTFEEEYKLKQERTLRIVERNKKAIELEKLGRNDESKIDEAIKLYEENISEESGGNHPYDRLAIIYRKRKQYDEEIRVLKKAIDVFTSLTRPDAVKKLAKFKERLEKVQEIKNNN